MIIHYVDDVVVVKERVSFVFVELTYRNTFESAMLAIEFEIYLALVQLFRNRNIIVVGVEG